MRLPSASILAQLKRSVHERAEQPDLLRVLLHTGTVYACFAVDIVFTQHMPRHLVAHTLLAVPHLSLPAMPFLGVFVLAALRATLVVGVRSAPMLFAFAPMRVTSHFTLRATPRWGRYASVAVGIACNVALQALATVLAAVPDRGDGYAGRSSWRREAMSWVLLAVHCGLVLAVFAGQRGMAARRGSVAGTQLLEGLSAPANSAALRYAALRPRRPGQRVRKAQSQETGLWTDQFM
eukprot:jgi/Ulvmu1/3301/UM153_0013.1